MEIESLKTVLSALVMSSPHTDSLYRWQDPAWQAQRADAIDIVATELGRLEQLPLVAASTVSNDRASKEAKASVNAAIVDAVLPMLYKVIDDLINSIGPGVIPKKELIEAQKALPPQYKHSLAKRRESTSANPL